jgi:flavin-dependent dehydrogenase
MPRICVIGAGPAGSVFSSRMAQLGHDVVLIERATFPRSHLGECLSPGVLPLLEMIGAREAVESAGFRRVRHVLMKWDRDIQERHDSTEQGLLVDRGHFDALLLARARALGVRVLQPASVLERRRDEAGWSLRVDTGGGTLDLRTDFLADASGRSGAVRGRRQSTGRRTFALYAYWRGRSLPAQPRIDAGAGEWSWGVPLPDGRYNTLVFVDADRLRARAASSIAGAFRELIEGSCIMTGSREARLDGPVLATDATPYLDEDSVSPAGIKVGDAACAIDPLSSSGVQKAVQTALAGAIVANTLLRRPGARDAATAFYRDSLRLASERHRGWAAEHYAAVAASRGGKFWDDRAVGPSRPAPRVQHVLDDRRSPESRIELSPELEFVDMPCIDGDFVVTREALRHPALDAPLAYLGGLEVAPLLRHVRPGMTPLQIARSWSARIPLKSSLAIASWLLDRGILAPQADGRAAGACP